MNKKEILIVALLGLIPHIFHGSDQTKKTDAQKTDSISPTKELDYSNIPANVLKSLDEIENDVEEIRKIMKKNDQK